MVKSTVICPQKYGNAANILYMLDLVYTLIYSASHSIGLNEPYFSICQCLVTKCIPRADAGRIFCSDLTDVCSEKFTSISICIIRVIVYIRQQIKLGICKCYVFFHMSFHGISVFYSFFFLSDSTAVPIPSTLDSAEKKSLLFSHDPIFILA